MRRRRHLHAAERRVHEACADATATAELIDGLTAPVTDALGLSGVILGATDPSTLLMSTAAKVVNLPPATAVPWMQNEFLEDDVNKFVRLHGTRVKVSTLHRATQHHPEMSARHRLHRRTGFGPELRVTFSAPDGCGGVANCLRADGEADFDDEALTWVERLRPTIAAALRRSVGAGVTDAEEPVPGVVTLDASGNLVSMTPSAEHLLADLWMCPIEGLGSSLPGEAFMVATLARAHAEGRSLSRPAMTRLRGRSGRWLTVRGEASLTAAGDIASIAIVVQPSRPAEVLPLVLAAYGLTPREREVFAEIASGRTTGEIATSLWISEHTVRDHVKAILTKTGTGSRGELMSLVVEPGVAPVATVR